MLLVEIMTLVLGLVEKICREGSEKCQFWCSMPTCDGPHSPQSNKNQLRIMKRACLSVWWAVMKINREQCVQISSHCVTMCTYKSNVYCNITYFKYIFCILCFLITYAWLTEECKVFYAIYEGDLKRNAHVGNTA